MLQILPAKKAALGGCFFLIAFMLLLSLFEQSVFSLLSLEPEKVSQGEAWRLLTANFVHFGWIHTTMNCAALLLCTLAFFTEDSLKQFLLLFLWCCAAVGIGIYLFNPEYSPYAGLSGAIHGLMVAGLLQTRAYPLWVRTIALIAIAAKLAQENSANYEATDLQALLPVAVAVESHAYGAFAGLIFAGGRFGGHWLIRYLNRKQ